MPTRKKNHKFTNGLASYCKSNAFIHKSLEMKRLLTVVSILLISAAWSDGIAQDSKPDRIKLVKFENGTNSLTKEQQIERCTVLIESLDKKEAYIRSNAEYTAQAEASGWFTKAEQTREKMRAQILILQSK